MIFCQAFSYVNLRERESMILKTNSCGDVYRLDYNDWARKPVNLYDTVYRVVVMSAEPPEFQGDLGTINDEHNVDNLHLVWTLLEEAE